MPDGDMGNTHLHSEIGSVCHVAEQSDLDHTGEHFDFAE